MKKRISAFIAAVTVFVLSFSFFAFAARPEARQALRLVDKAKLIEKADEEAKQIRKKVAINLLEEGWTVEKIAYKIRQENGYKEITHSEVRKMVDGLGTKLIDMGLKDKRIAVIGENRYEKRK